MKTTVLLLAALTMFGCRKPPAPPETPIERWRYLTKQIQELKTQVHGLMGERSKLNDGQEVFCRQQTPPATWAVVDEAGPTCFDAALVDRLQATVPIPAPVAEKGAKK